MRCLMCGKKMTTDTFSDLFRQEDVLCSDCRSGWKRIDRRFRFDGIPAFALYEYNDAFSSCLIQFKECGDEALKHVFLYPDQRKLERMYKGSAMLLLPSSRKKQQERGFSHLYMLFSQLRLPVLEPFVKVDEIEQKEMNFVERQKMTSGIALKEGIEIPKRIVLADDVITTGSTMRGAIAVLPKRRNIRIFACAVSPLLEKKRVS